jgi:hypothetical protein
LKIVNYKLSIPLVCLIFIVGCVPFIENPLPVCPGSDSVEHALEILQKPYINMVSFKATGQCRLTYYQEGENEPKHETLNITIFVRSLLEIYLQGGTSVLPKMVTAGSNKDEFWLGVSLKEISSYWTGRWSQLNSSQDLLINPRSLLEALGVADVDLAADWSLSNEGPFDILTKRLDDIVAMKIYIFCCDGNVRKIEYFDKTGQLYSIVELDEYKKVTEKFSIPGKIIITKVSQDKDKEPVGLKLKFDSVKEQKMTNAQDKLFQGSSRGYENIYRFNNGQWIKQ